MTNAATGNPMIPVHPQIQAQHAQASTASQPSNGQAGPAQTASQDTVNVDWANLAASMGFDDEMGGGAPAPQNFVGGQPAQQQYPQQGAQAPAQQQQPGQPQQPAPVSPEQMEAIARANMEQQPQQGHAAPANPQQQMSPEQAVATATQHLLNTTYKLTDAQKQQLIAEPDVAIPQLAAQMHVTIATQLGQFMHQAIQTMVPQMAVAAMQRQMGAFKAEQGFFGKYPQLNRPEFRTVVLQCLKLAKGYAESNGQRPTREQVMEDAAGMAAYKLKVNLTPQQQQQQPQQQQRQPHTPAQMPQQQFVPQMPFMPATGAPAQSNNGAAPSGNIFEELAGDPNW